MKISNEHKIILGLIALGAAYYAYSNYQQNQTIISNALDSTSLSNIMNQAGSTPSAYLDMSTIAGLQGFSGLRGMRGMN